MRTLTIGLTALFASISTLGILFKIMHWPGANIGLLVGIAGLAIVSIPLIAYQKIQTTNN
ncbi:MAG: hypothetical protein HWE22_01825 [Flavobacteriales bacterium]|nr:hypothetical protein [Flavobacteriales bacterium]